MIIESLEKLINIFSTLPGIGEKSAERLTLALLGKEKAEIDELIAELEEMKNITHCEICNTLTTSKVCNSCANDQLKNIICVTDDIKNIMLFSKNQIFEGRYFLLNSLINPIKGIAVDELNINQLEKMIQKFKSEEIFLALRPSIEGETTALYLAQLLRKKIKVTKMAQGIPLGTEIEYLDILTIEQAMRDRKEV